MVGPGDYSTKENDISSYGVEPLAQGRIALSEVIMTLQHVSSRSSFLLAIVLWVTKGRILLKTRTT